MNNEEGTPASIAELPVNGRGNPQQQQQDDPGHDHRSSSLPLEFLETEVKRLQTRWASIEGEVRSRDRHINELQQQVDARDLVAANLTRRLEESKRAAGDLQEEILKLENAAAEFKLSLAERDMKLSEKQEVLRSAEETRTGLQRKLTEAKGEIEALQKGINDERESAAETIQRSTELQTVNDELLGTLQDLEAYVDARKQHWLSKDNDLADYKDTISEMERVIKQRDNEVRASKKVDEKLRLKISELQRQAAELDGRRGEREQAYRDLEAKMVAHTQETTDIRVDLAQRIKEADAAMDRAAADEATRVSLQHGIERRDKSLAEVEHTLQQQTSDYDKMESTVRKQATRIDELEHGMEERLNSNQELRTALKEAHQEVDTARTSIADTNERAATLEQEAQQLKTELLKAHEDLERLREQHRDAREQADASVERASKLDQSAKALTAQRDTLQEELAAQQELVQVLESDLEGKRETLDVLDRSVDRLHELGKSIEELEHDFADFESTETLGDADELELVSAASLIGDSVDDGQAQASDADMEATDNDDTGVHEYVPTDDPVQDDDIYYGVELDSNNDDEGQDYDDDSENTVPRLRVVRLMVALGGNRGIKYPIYKHETTIGRSRRSDIQVHSKFISRIHARLISDPDGLRIEDTGSKNGVTVNEEVVTHERLLLHSGDTIRVGATKFKFVERTKPA